jgi:hypothetical protein
MKENKREIALSIRVSKKELDSMKDRAKQLGLSVSNLIRLVVFNYNYVNSATKECYNEKTGKYRHYKCSFTGHIDDSKVSSDNNYIRYMLGIENEAE